MGEFQNGLFGCFNNVSLCVITYFVPCLTAGRNAEAVGENCVLYGCLTLLGPVGIWSRAKIRGMVRESKGIEGEFIKDCVLHWFCAFCALIQEAQELGVGAGAQGQSMARE